MLSPRAQAGAEILFRVLGERAGLLADIAATEHLATRQAAHDDALSGEFQSRPRLLLRYTAGSGALRGVFAEIPPRQAPRLFIVRRKFLLTWGTR